MFALWVCIVGFFVVVVDCYCFELVVWGASRMLFACLIWVLVVLFVCLLWIWVFW